MNKLKLERLYKEAGLNDYKLKTIDDLLSIHAVKFSQIDGYSSLNDKDKIKLKKYVVSFFNSRDLEFRDMTPIKVFVVSNVDKSKEKFARILRLQYIQRGKEYFFDIKL